MERLGLMGKRWGKADFRELKKLERRIDKLEKTDFDRLCRELANELAARLLAKVKKRTPVDRKSTRLNSSHIH